MKNKKNFLFALIGAGTLVLSAGVGFAAWTINGTSDKKEDSSLKLSADATVTDNRIVLDQTKTNWSDQTVKFIPVKKTSYSPALKTIWLDVADEEQTDDLGAKFHVEGTVPGNKTITIKPTLSDTTQPDAANNIKSYQDRKSVCRERV